MPHQRLCGACAAPLTAHDACRAAVLDPTLKRSSWTPAAASALARRRHGGRVAPLAAHDASCAAVRQPCAVAQRQMRVARQARA